MLLANKNDLAYDSSKFALNISICLEEKRQKSRPSYISLKRQYLQNKNDIMNTNNFQSGSDQYVLVLKVL